MCGGTGKIVPSSPVVPSLGSGPTPPREPISAEQLEYWRENFCLPCAYAYIIVPLCDEVIQLRAELAASRAHLDTAGNAKEQILDAVSELETADYTPSVWVVVSQIRRALDGIDTRIDSRVEQESQLAAARSLLRDATRDTEAMRAALVKIEKGEGRYSRDPITHAENTITDMQAIARAALSAAPIPAEDRT
jgi:hypothetical protein